MHIDVGPAYLPQALGRMLPWLIPLGPEAKGYAFASYVRESRQRMMRYVDMKPIVQEMMFNGQSVGYEVRDRLGLEGAPTVNYFTLEGTIPGQRRQVGENGGVADRCTDDSKHLAGCGAVAVQRNGASAGRD